MTFLAQRIRYRLWQFKQELLPRPLSLPDWEQIQTILSPAQLELFRRFSPSDQVHSCRVMQLLVQAGHQQPDLLAAALLHDVGKTKTTLLVWERALIVLASAFVPGRMAHWGQGEAQGCSQRLAQRPFVVREKHPAWGAEMAQAVGSTLLTVSLIRRHQDVLPAVLTTQEDCLLSYLQWADDQN